MSEVIIIKNPRFDNKKQPVTKRLSNFNCGSIEYREGREAVYNGGNCPYKIGSRAHLDWRLGWNDETLAIG